MAKLLDEIMDMVCEIDSANRCEETYDPKCEEVQEKIDVLWAVLQDEKRAAYLNSLFAA